MLIDTQRKTDLSHLIITHFEHLKIEDWYTNWDEVFNSCGKLQHWNTNWDERRDSWTFPWRGRWSDFLQHWLRPDMIHPRPHSPSWPLRCRWWGRRRRGRRGCPARGCCPWRPRGILYRVVQMNFTADIEVFYMLFERYLYIFSMKSLKQHI